MRLRFSLALMLLLPGIRCFGSDTALLQRYACVHPGVTSYCTVTYGDTLWGFSAAAYGNGDSYATITAANPEIVDPNKIYTGEKVVVPATSATEFRVKPRVNLSWMEAPLSTEPSPELTAQIVRKAVADNVLPTSFPLRSFTPALLSTNARVERSEATAKVSGYEFTVHGSDLRGKLQTQLVLFNSEEEKRVGLPRERIDLKPSLAVPAKDGDTIVFVHLKKFPSQPFVLLVGGINIPVDGTQVRPYSGKIPGTPSFARTMAFIGRTGAQGTVSFLAGGPIAAACVVGIPQIVKLGIALHERAREHALAAAQAAVDRSKLALYRASAESETLSKETLR